MKSHVLLLTVISLQSLSSFYCSHQNLLKILMQISRQESKCPQNLLCILSSAGSSFENTGMTRHCHCRIASLPTATGDSGIATEM